MSDLDLSTVLTSELKALVSIRENGVRRTVTKLEVVIQQLVNHSMAGDIVAIRQLITLLVEVDPPRDARAERERASRESLRKMSDEELQALHENLIRDEGWVRPEEISLKKSGTGADRQVLEPKKAN